MADDVKKFALDCRAREYLSLTDRTKQNFCKAQIINKVTTFKDGGNPSDYFVAVGYYDNWLWMMTRSR